MSIVTEIDSLISDLCAAGLPEHEAMSSVLKSMTDEELSQYYIEIYGNRLNLPFDLRVNAGRSRLIRMYQPRISSWEALRQTDRIHGRYKPEYDVYAADGTRIGYNGPEPVRKPDL